MDAVVAVVGVAVDVAVVDVPVDVVVVEAVVEAEGKNENRFRCPCSVPDFCLFGFGGILRSTKTEVRERLL